MAELTPSSMAASAWQSGAGSKRTEDTAWPLVGGTSVWDEEEVALRQPKPMPKLEWPSACAQGKGLNSWLLKPGATPITSGTA